VRRFEDDITALATVATVRATPRNVLLTAKANDSVSTVPTSYSYLYAINHAFIICLGLIEA
jgi:hypothetical protein